MKHSFSIDETIPFLAFRKLKEIAVNTVGEINVLDLSQGEPGYGFSPNVRSRQFFSFIAMLDIAFNNHRIDSDTNLFFKRKPEELAEIELLVETVAREKYSENLAIELIADWKEFIAELEKICDAQNLEYSRFDIYYELFKYSNLMGGRYPQPAGHPLLQATMAEEYSKVLGVRVKAHELVGIMGASHGIGATFQALGSEGIKYLKRGHTVVMTSPVYAPYNAIFEERGINVISLSVNPETGEIDEDDLKKVKSLKEKVRAIILIDPNNPTGFASSDVFLKGVIDIAEEHNSLIITDSVYLRFFDDTRTIANYPEARKRLIQIDSLSKIERATGVRAGDIYVSDEANTYITENILQNYFLKKYKDIRHLLFLAKSPGGKNIGLFQHITGIPGPSVAISLAHVILGKEERAEYVRMLQKKVSLFYEYLELPYHGNMYYGMVDLESIESETSKARDIEEVMEDIAKMGVVVMPANLFFSRSDRHKKDRRRVIRVSLPNLSYEGTKSAAQIIKEVTSR